jgi:hypothetical protein
VIEESRTFFGTQLHPTVFEAASSGRLSGRRASCRRLTPS